MIAIERINIEIISHLARIEQSAYHISSFYTQINRLSTLSMIVDPKGSFDSRFICFTFSA